MKLSPNEIAYCLASVGFAGTELRNGIAVWLAESGGDTEIFGKVSADSYANWDHGAGQISNKWHGDKLAANPTWRDPLTMAKLTKLVYDESVAAGKPGWNPWHVFTSSSYKTYLPAADIAMKHPFRPVSEMEIYLKKAFPQWELQFVPKD